MDVTIYTSGFCPNAYEAGTWAAVMVSQGHSAQRELTGSEESTTNNQMELQACISALRALKRPCAVKIVTCATYVSDGASIYLDGWKARGWKNAKRESIKNIEQWKELDRLCQIHDVQFVWDRSNTSTYNTSAYDLAKRCFESFSRAPSPREQTSASEAVAAPPLHRGREATIYTDGSCLGNPGPGGWAAIIQGGGITSEISGGEDSTTNNRMELRAAIEAIEATEATKIRLYTDSKYVVDGIGSWLAGWRKNGWRTKENKAIKNVDLWRRMDMAIKGIEVQVDWVKGHAGHPLNERCDVLARTEAKRVQQESSPAIGV